MKLQGIVDKVLLVSSLVLICLSTFGVLKHVSSSDKYQQVTEHVYAENNLNTDIVQHYIDILPECLKQHFTGDGDWKVYVVSSLPDNVKGQTVIEDKSVYIVSGYEFDLLLHEFAHVYLHENPLGSEFEKIYEEEALQMIEAYWGTASEYHYSNSIEYYCTAWNIVFTLGGNDTMDVAPKTFSYFTELFNKLY